MKVVSTAIQALGAEDISSLEINGSLALAETGYTIGLEDVEIIAEDVAGWQVANLGNLTVALDVQITPELKQEGIARELINRIQNLRKEKEFEVTDRIRVQVSRNNEIEEAAKNNLSYICTEILADSFDFVDVVATNDSIEINESKLEVLIEKY